MLLTEFSLLNRVSQPQTLFHPAWLELDRLGCSRKNPLEPQNRSIVFFDQTTKNEISRHEMTRPLNLVGTPDTF